MASQKNPQQIIRKDGKNCFVEVMNSSFAIDRVLFNFNAYNPANNAGSKITSSIQIYLTFDEFYRICHDFTVSCSILKEILNSAEEAKRTGNKYPKPKVLCMGGRSAEALSRSNQARPDGMSLSRQMKVYAGDRLPVILTAESGPGMQNETGLIVPKYQQPEQRVSVAFTYESLREMFLITKAHVDAYIASKYVMAAMHPEQNAAPQGNNRNNYQSSYSKPQNNTYNNNQNSRPINNQAPAPQGNAYNNSYSANNQANYKPVGQTVPVQQNIPPAPPLDPSYYYSESPQQAAPAAPAPQPAPAAAPAEPPMPEINYDFFNSMTSGM